MKAIVYADTTAKGVQSPDFRSLVRPYYGEVLGLCEGPQTFLVEMPDEGSTIKPHFHDVDQFQVVIEGGGRLGKEKAEPVVFHYADAFTPYGPIVAGKEGISFYTVRAACAGGYFGMPQSRHLIAGKPGRNIAGKFVVNKSLPAAGDAVREALLTAGDGMMVAGLRMGANARAVGFPLSGGAQYYIVSTGSLIHEEHELPRRSMMFVQPGEAPAALISGPEGAEVLVLQLPRGGNRPGSEIKSLAERGLSTYSLPSETKVSS